MKQIKKFFQSDWNFTMIVNLEINKSENKHEIQVVGVAPIRDRNNPSWDYTALTLVDLSGTQGVEILEKCISDAEWKARCFAITQDKDWMQMRLINNGFENACEFNEDHFKEIPEDKY